MIKTSQVGLLLVILKIMLQFYLREYNVTTLGHPKLIIEYDETVL